MPKIPLKFAIKAPKWAKLSAKNQINTIYSITTMEYHLPIWSLAIARVVKGDFGTFVSDISSL